MSYKHLTLSERCCIYQFKISEMSIRQIDIALNCSPSTISRELKRNSYKTIINCSTINYSPNKAQELANERKVKITALKEYPDDLIKTITFNRAKELYGYKG